MAGENRRTALELYHIDPNTVKNSKKWFDEQVNKLATKKITPNRLMMGDGGMHLTSRLRPGRPVFFYYDPKGKDTLPYYDQFPLVIPYAKDNNGFIGLNLHYLDYRPRMMLFRELLKIYGQNRLTEAAKIQYSWDLIRGASKLKAAAPCIKRYLMSHLQSPFCEIPVESWHTAMMMPVQRFVGASKEQVWKESASKMRW
jgi:hypothetical protein